MKHILLVGLGALLTALGMQSQTANPRIGAPEFGSQLLASFASATNLSANVSATAIAASGWVTGINTIPVTGRYMICMEMKETQAATSSSTSPSITVQYTSGIDSVANVSTNLSNAGFNSSGNSTTVSSASCAIVTIASGSTVTYKTSAYASSGATVMTYAFNIEVYTAP